MKYLLRPKKPIYEFEFSDAWRVRFYYREGSLKDTYVEIETRSGVMSLRLSGTCYAYGYLLESARQDKRDNILGFCRLMWIMADNIYEDEKLFKDIVRDINAYDKRLERKAQKLSEATTKEDEATAKAIMDEAVEYSQMKRGERRKRKKTMAKTYKEMSNNGEFNNEKDGK